MIYQSRTSRRGAAAVLAMLFLTILTTLCVAMVSLSGSNVQSASNLSDVARAQMTAESGLRWAAWRFTKINRPKTTVGNITPAVANSLWPSLRTAIAADFNTMLNPAERPVTVTTRSITSSPIAIDNAGGRFVVRIEQYPRFAGDGLDERYLRVTSTGTYRGSSRTISMDFRIDKKVKFAVVGRVPIQLGRNTIVEGPVATTSSGTGSSPDPLYMLSDFMHLTPALTSKITAWQNFLKANHSGYDGRISVNNATEYPVALANGYYDYNGDAYVDEYDLFVREFDSNGDKGISRQEFTNPTTSQLYDENLFNSIDSLSGPMFAGDPIRAGYQDGLIDNRDGYMKIRGNLLFTMSDSAWQNGGPLRIPTAIVGPIAPNEPNVAPIRFNAPQTDIFDLLPENFEQAAEGFRSRAGTSAGAPVRTATLIANTTLVAADANGGQVTEITPFGVVGNSHQATYKRRVIRNKTLRNVIIPRGYNALFDNCTFEGVTFVDIERNVTASSAPQSSSTGMTYAKTRTIGSASFTNNVVLDNTTYATKGSQNGNNLRFHNCTFRGPIAGAYATAYTHFANSWEFTGATLFDNQVDQTATIVSPQVNIEMGSFTDPNAAPSTLVGVVVAGNLDVRGTSVVDGSIIITGDGAGNTTLGYFGPRDDQTNPTAMPEGGYGRLMIRYNPYRTLPDGINVPIDLMAQIDSYREGSQ